MPQVGSLAYYQKCILVLHKLEIHTLLSDLHVNLHLDESETPFNQSDTEPLTIGMAFAK